MKRVWACILTVVILLVCALFNGEIVYGTENLSGYEVDLVNDSSGVFLTGRSRDTLIVKKLAPEGTEHKYKIENQISAVCIYADKVYILYNSPSQKDVSYIEAFKNGVSENKIRIINLSFGALTKMSVDSKGNFYIINSQCYIEIFDKNGRHLSTTENKFYNLTQSGGKAYATSHEGLFILDKDSFEKLGDCNNSVIYRISDNYLGDRSGNIYRIKNGFKKILNTKNKFTCGAGETDKYIVSYSGDKLTAYDKESGKQQASVNLGYTPSAVSAYNNSVVILSNRNGDYSAEAKTENIFKATDTEQENSKSDNNAASKFKFGKYKPKGKYIYIPYSTTYAQFRKSVTLNGYNIDFGGRKSGSIATASKVSLSNGNTKKTYTFIVLGDITGEGNINSRDINSLFSHLLDATALKGAHKKAADMNGDGKISNADLVLTVRAYNKLK